MITMTKALCLEMLDAFVKKNGRVPRMDEFSNANGLPSRNTVLKYNGDILILLKQRYPQYYKNWDAKKIRSAVDSFIEERGYYPKVHDFIAKNRLPTIKEFENHCGYIPDVLAEWYEDYVPRIHRWNEKRVIEAIAGFVQKHNRLPKANEFNRSNRLPGHKMVRDYCGTFSSLYEKYFTEYAPNKPRWTKEKIIERLDAFVCENQRLPKMKEFRAINNLPSFCTVQRHIGSVYDFILERYSKRL